MASEQLVFISTDHSPQIHKLRKTFFVRYKEVKKELDFLRQEIYPLMNEIKERLNHVEKEKGNKE